MSSLPAIGMVVQRAASKQGPVRRERILWLDRAHDTAATIALDDEKAVPELISAKELDRLWVKGTLTLSIDEFAHLVTADVKHKGRRDKNWRAIKAIVSDEPKCFDRVFRASMLTAAEKTSERSRNTLIRDLRRYWQSGKQKNALATNYDRSGAGGERRISENGKKPGRASVLERHGHVERGPAVTPETAKLFDMYLKKYVLKLNPQSLPYAFGKLIEEKYSTTKRSKSGRLVTEPLPLDRRPTLRQFRYYAKKEHGISAVKKAQDGVEAYEQTMRPVLGNSSLVMGPGSVFQIDATETDTHMVNSIMRERPIGRATHYFMTDAFSGLIGGMHAGIESPSVLMVRQTLANTAQSKVSFCERYEIPIEDKEWPCRHFPESIIADRGEIIAKSADAVVDEHNLKITNLPAFRPDWKPFVEGNFALANHVLHTLPGAIRRTRNEIRKKDPRLEAQLDIFGINQILIQFVLYYNPFHILESHPFDLFEIQHNIKPRPLDLWQWGVLHRSGALRVKSEDAIRMLLLERGEATVTGHGLRFLEADYDCSLAHELEWFQKARTQGHWKVQICFDRRNLEFIYLLPEGRRPLIACPILRRDEQMIGLSLEDIQDYQKFLEYRDALMREEQLAGKVNLHARVEDVVEEQRKRTRDRKKDTPPVSKSAATQGVRDSRNEERARQNAKVHEGVQGTSPAAAPSNTQATQPKASASTTSLSDFRESRGLKLLRERRQGK
ncbi:Mu transposase C-terminal domain-containing protein [Thermomonas sp. HDW16]|uniref:Mu transposase C-terminal domain-containing protein n=1 Tax=Thermomonas sp. HDW16 TaxID=2714945 RepID=UPI00140B1BBB|nr:Mu transposase C-terminal domain-containing protein [Thermomonas sp. HDW16]QIL19746.1 hypothetical protein G7079_02830 [Thermomonas sp. HDW16]